MTGKVDFSRIFEFVFGFFSGFFRFFAIFFDIKGYFFIKSWYFLYIWEPQGTPNQLKGPGPIDRVEMLVTPIESPWWNLQA